MKFGFEEKDKLDYRSEFANRVCKMIWYEYGGDIQRAVDSMKDIYNDFHENVGNIYELCDDEIPLFAFYNFEKRNKDEELSDEDYDREYDRIYKACDYYYE